MSGHIDRNVSLPGGGTRYVYNITEDTSRETREMELQNTITEQKDALDHLEACFRNAETPDEQKLKK